MDQLSFITLTFTVSKGFRNEIAFFFCPKDDFLHSVFRF